MKRLLTLDGGGIRGVFSLEMLARIEQLLREKTGTRISSWPITFITLAERARAQLSPPACRGE